MAQLTLLDIVPCLEGKEASLAAIATRAGLQADPADLPATALASQTGVDDMAPGPLAVAIANELTENQSLSEQRLGTLLPDLARVEGRLFELPGVHLRTAELATFTLEITRASQLADWSPRSLSAEGRGEFARTISAAAITATADAVIAVQRTIRRRQHDEARDLLGRLAMWGLHELQLRNVREVLTHLTSPDGTEPPEEVVRLMELKLSDISAGDPTPYDLDAGLSRLTEFPERDRAILLERIYPADKAQTLDALGTRFGCTRERIRQIEKTVKTTLSNRLETRRDLSVVHRAASRLRAQLGACCAVAEGPRFAGLAIGDVAPADTDEGLHARLLLSLAGPYERYEQWVVRTPASALVKSSRDQVTAALGEGSLDDSALGALLGALGIPPSEHQAWLADVCRCRKIEGTWVLWTGRLADKAARILTVHGSPLSNEEIAAGVGPNVNCRSLNNDLHSDERFLRRGVKLFGLAEWGGEEYTSIQDEVAEEIERQGGAASIDHLVAALCTQFGVAETSVRAYAREAPFITTPDGLVTAGVGTGSYTKVAIEDCRGCFRSGERWAFRLVVDYDIQRGSGRPISAGIVQYLGLKPGERTYAGSPVGELLFRYGRQATVGSLRKAAESVGGVEGDLLFVEMIDNAAVVFRKVPRAALDETSGLARLALEVGVASTATAAEVAAALGLEPGDQSLGAIKRRLRARRESDLLELLANHDHTEKPSYEDIADNFLG